MSELIVLHGCATVQLTKGQNTLVDERDVEWMSQRKWCASFKTDGSCYAVGSDWIAKRSVCVYMHREVRRRADGGLAPRIHVDHKNRDTLDNRRDNVRLATVSQNRSNSVKKLWRGGKSSEYKGVSFHKKSRKWRAIIVSNKKFREIGRYDVELDAARAYNKAAIETHGEFARINEGI